MALAMSATKIQALPQPGPSTEPVAEPVAKAAASEAIPLFADALCLLSCASDEPAPEETAETADAPALAESSAPTGTEPVSALPEMVPAMLAVASYVLAPSMPPAPAPVSTAAGKEDGGPMETAGVAELQGSAGLPGLPAAGLAQRRMADIPVPGTAALPPAFRLPDANAANAADASVAAGDADLSQLSPSMSAAASQLVEHALAGMTRKQGAAVGAVSDLPPAAPQGVPSDSPGVDTVQSLALKLPAGAPQQWRQPLLDSLGERLRMQIGARSENAVIRLDPPMMGQIEIRIHHEAGALQIQLSASNGEVLRQLNDIRENLRQDLAHRQYTDVSVQVSGNLPDGRQRQRQPEAELEVPGHALADYDQQNSAFALLSEKD